MSHVPNGILLARLDAIKPTQPYLPTEPAPKGWTLKDAFKHDVTPDGQYRCGKLSFESKHDYLDFVTAQTRLGGSKEQLGILHQIETTGKIPRQEPVAFIPKGTTVDALLDLHGQKPDVAGNFHLGSIRVKATEFESFSKLQRETARLPEGLAQLYHMEHSAGRPLTYRVTNGADRVDRYEPGTNSIFINEKTGVRDFYSGVVLPVSTAAVHEQGHMLGRAGIATLSAIPAGRYSNLEEKRVIDGAELRDSTLHKRIPRASHIGWAINVPSLTSTTPSLNVEENGKAKELVGPLTLSGTFGESKNGFTTMHLPAGAAPAHDLKIRTEELVLAIDQSSPMRAKGVIENARNHRDVATIELTKDGRMVYGNETQRDRLTAHPETGIKYPDTLMAVTRPRELARKGLER